ncbi:MAG: hypothetical protein HWN68_11175 [Desulfobacterales bacterium]|nr:hypothetical protein [Desulfobacterales bacterium]
MSNYEEMYKEYEKAGGVETLTPQFVEFKKEGQSVLGAYISSADIQGKIGEGTYKQYVFNTDKGLVKFAMGNATDREVFPQLIVGDIYHVVFQGQEDIGGGKRVNKFKVEHLVPKAAPGKSEVEKAPF